jgi:putative transposase
MFRRIYTYKLRPNRQQREKLAATLDLCRNLYNCALEQRKMQRMSKFAQMRELTDVRDSFAEYRRVHVHVLQNVIKRLHRSFQNFFRRVKNGEKPGFPRFKGKDRYDSFEFNNTGYSLQGNRLHISKIGNIRLHLSRLVKSEIKQLRILRRVDGWFAQFVVKVEGEHLPANHDTVGIDVGSENFAALSNGEFVENPTFYGKMQQELRRAQRRVARRRMGSHRRRKAVVLLRKIHQRIANRRINFLHQQSRTLGDRFGIIVHENLDIRGLSQGFLSRQVHDAGWGVFLRMLSYKAEEAGRAAVGVDCSYTSQTCPSCGEIKQKPLAERVHRCDCGFTAHRDTAAALVLLGRIVPLGANAGAVSPCVA